MADQNAWASGAAEVASGSDFIVPITTPYSNIRFSTIAQTSADYLGGELQSDGSQNAEVTFARYWQSGTYTMDVHTKSGATHGIISPFIDGVALGTTIDTYAAAGALQRATIAGIVIPFSGLHLLRLLMATKNGTATSFIGILMGIGMVRTGP